MKDVVSPIRADGSFFVGIDVGGTFTDLVLYDVASGSLSVVKVPSDRQSPDRAVIRALDECAVAPEKVGLLVHGTTVATNALLERRGARAAFVTTEGFRDVLELGRTTRLVPDTLYQPYFRRPRPLIERRDRHEVAERTSRDGNAEAHPADSDLDNMARKLADEGVESVAIGFLNSFRNAENEERARTVFSKYFEHVTISTTVLNEIREFERFSATAINAYVMPVMARYSGALGQELARRSKSTGFFTVGSHGGLLSAEAIVTQPARTVLSGPAAGIAATVHLAKEIGLRDIVTFDVGGTSSDVALITDATFPLKRETILDGLVIKLPQLDIHTVGAGGGSVASLDAGGGLEVGPESAGAVPGPAAYGLGGERPTLTDANVVLGRLAGDDASGRAVHIDTSLATKAVTALSKKAGLDAEEMSEAILRVGIAKMASAVREISAMRGQDPRGCALLSYGGAGPLHAALVAEQVGISTVVVPPMPGAFSALGTLCSSLTKDAAETVFGPLDDAGLDRAIEASKRISHRLAEDFSGEGRDPAEIRYEQQLDLRYAGQAHELAVTVALAEPLAIIVETFEAAFEKEYGRRDTDRGVELVNVRVIARLPMPTPVFPEALDGSGRSVGNRETFIDGAFRKTALWRREDLRRNTPVSGPAIVEEMSSTTYVPPSWIAKLGRVGELQLNRS